MMEGSGEPGRGNTDNHIGDDPRFVANLTVWEDVKSLENFVWNTVHRQFYDRRHEWFQVLEAMHFVMWWVPKGHKPTLEEGLARLDRRRRLKATASTAFGWAYLKDAQLWQSRNCAHEAAE